MIWTLALISTIANAPFPCNRGELIDYAERSGAPLVVIENLLELESDGLDYSDLSDIWPDMPDSDYEFGWQADEY